MSGIRIKHGLMTCLLTLVFLVMIIPPIHVYRSEIGIGRFTVGAEGNASVLTGSSRQVRRQKIPVSPVSVSVSGDVWVVLSLPLSLSLPEFIYLYDILR